MKKYIPAPLKELIKTIQDFISWTQQYRLLPIVIENKYHIKQLLYPWDKKYMRLIVNAHDYIKEFTAADILIRPGDTVFDIGANLGVLSAYYSRQAGTTGVVHAFEPVSTTFAMLEENIALNHCQNIHLHHCGISDRAGSVEMSILEQKYHTQNSLGNIQIDITEPKKTEIVSLDTLDTFCTTRNIPTIDFLKVDVEGFEENVFKGAAGLLTAKKISYIQFEISLSPLVGSNNTVASLFATLHTYGYLVYRFDENTKKFSGPIQKEDNNYDNYYASYHDLTTAF